MRIIYDAWVTWKYAICVTCDAQKIQNIKERLRLMRRMRRTNGKVFNVPVYYPCKPWSDFELEYE